MREITAIKKDQTVVGRKKSKRLHRMLVRLLELALLAKVEVAAGAAVVADFKSSDGSIAVVARIRTAATLLRVQRVEHHHRAILGTAQSAELIVVVAREAVQRD
jgi:hypothetical protein